MKGSRAPSRGQLRPRNQNVASRRKLNPPQLPSNVVITRTYRFRSTSDTKTAVTAGNIGGIAGLVCTVANTTLSYLAVSSKVHRVSIWTPPASQGAAATCSIEWVDIDAVGSKEFSDTTVSTAFPAHVSSVPPVGSAAYQWQSTAGGGALMNITAPIGSVIDVHASHVLFDTGTAAPTAAVAAGTLGVLYYLPLDGVTDVFLPVGLNTTT